MFLQFLRVLAPVLILSFINASGVYSQKNIKSVLILGDSYLKGHFGEYFHQKLHETGNYDVLSIAIGGAGSRTFISSLKNECCGYRVRQTCAGEALIKNKKTNKTKIPILERAEKTTSGVVMKWFGGRLISILNLWKPDVIIIVLGTNHIDAHDDLLALVKGYKPDIPLIWIGSFDPANSAGRYTRIEKALKEMSGSFLIKSDSIVNKLKITPDHFTGAAAKKLSDAIYCELESFLENSLCTTSVRMDN